jgi:hypothetical protein
MTNIKKVITEHVISGRRLGRHINVDPRNANYPFLVKALQPHIKKLWKRTVVLDQGDLGSCVGNGAVGLLATEPFKRPRARITEKMAVKVYSLATKLDQYGGEYPPEDTGSSILGGMKALKQLGLIKEYRWCSTLEDVLQAIMYNGPVEVGVNWYSGFDNPDTNGLVHVNGHIRGGHAFDLIGADPVTKTVTAVNSWGAGWGVKGRFRFSWSDLDRLMKEDGEASTVTI